MLDDDEIRFHVGVRVDVPGEEEFSLFFDWEDEDVIIRCSRVLSEGEGQRLENLATNFVGNIAEVIFKVQ